MRSESGLIAFRLNFIIVNFNWSDCIVSNVSFWRIRLLTSLALSTLGSLILSNVDRKCGESQAWHVSHETCLIINESLASPTLTTLILVHAFAIILISPKYVVLVIGFVNSIGFGRPHNFVSRWSPIHAVLCVQVLHFLAVSELELASNLIYKLWFH